jgi:hypothetical protein
MTLRRYAGALKDAKQHQEQYNTKRDTKKPGNNGHVFLLLKLSLDSSFWQGWRL